MKEKIEQAKGKIERLIQSYEFGKIAKEGVKIAIIGKPNVGKSSLLNALLKDERAIVTAFPGTTRDTIEEGFDLLGIPAVLVDTAGIRKSADLPEQIGIERTKKSLEECESAIVVLDGSVKLSEEDEEVLGLAGSKHSVVIAVNKSDLEPKIELERVKRNFSDFPVVSISALKNEGIETLLEILYKKVVPLQGDRSQWNGQVFVSSLRHRNCLIKAQESLQSVIGLFQEGFNLECAAQDLREAIDALGEIVGELATDDLLTEIFSKFCIGK